MAWIAHVDESMRQRRDGSGIYVLAAATFDECDADELRSSMLELTGSKGRFHWRDEKPASRHRAVTLVNRLDALHLVVIGVGLDNSRQERGRRQCMTRLLWELDRAGVYHLWFDARRPRQNLHDRRLVQALRSRHIVGPGLRVDFVEANNEPLTWLPDLSPAP